MEKLTLLLLSFLIAFACFCQTEGRPGWIYKTPKASNDTYMYKVYSSFGDNPDDARKKALNFMLQDIMSITGGRHISSDQVANAIEAGKSPEEISRTYNIRYNKVCEYHEKRENANGCITWILCQIPKRLDIAPDFTSFDGCYDTKKYRNWVSGVESAFLPGLGQMTKRRGGKGSLFLLSEMALAGGAITTKIFANERLNTLKGNKIDFSSYNTAMKEYNNMRLINNICLWTLVAVHVGNIVHATLAKPKYKTSKNNKHTSFYPAVIQSPYESNMALGVGCTIAF